MGEARGITTPRASTLSELAAAALGRDMRARGRTLAALGRDNVEAILDDAKSGAAP